MLIANLLYNVAQEDLLWTDGNTDKPEVKTNAKGLSTLNDYNFSKDICN